ncbi:hypothetical protein D7Z54_32315 [Salibacterium salarium]|uniref:PD(D/E)XK endonuclease domain-containing protein n=1 Tax=Salibacterium salarium TaxID=284579 RepID=A0A3R9QMM5_9BACI|nr:hypothetical protein [Salibacterium salarium]RSL29224.1 hypothetical protein D7Z54_32315 [Salibacterium salarium]
MAHKTAITGEVSELTVDRILLANGWQVSKPVVAEAYDRVVIDPANERRLKAQIKTMRVREDRDGALVIPATKGNGSPYTAEDCDLMIGVLGETIYVTETRGILEYWSDETTASQRWVSMEMPRPAGEMLVH